MIPQGAITLYSLYFMYFRFISHKVLAWFKFDMDKDKIRIILFDAEVGKVDCVRYSVRVFIGHRNHLPHRRPSLCSASSSPLQSKQGGKSKSQCAE